MLAKIISGGQTGADRAGLDAAIDRGLDHGGWIPRGRRTENGRLPERYRMRETASSSYPDRTRKNVLSADGTVVFTRGRPTGGSSLTLEVARRHSRPVLHINLLRRDRLEAAVVLYEWLLEHRIRTLNVAGCRESKAPGIYQDVYQVIIMTVEALQGKRALSLFCPAPQ